ncbi:tetratricopeptide repeat protein [Limnoraphis robusta Tam1]|uniref:Tetratricopeptide repeat protein n=1 Tax=Limnoraphis robusta CCNP1315 TaxID=3110306 RepID=A0ABU5U4H2_9CYAN|nr:tetratricopeptide repeat protein [Limnoraphis robusta]MEA5498906.1 tetratricopeptide repeat protein [Limnoraphis robusta BA-68 BA1]MEA5521811.1 tetratricopeptide repeat protein [Limnoraphis robusta CCNP1315]MEA5540490.1 tetratricopeptide repeat protein [Limnoraphis robusta Tam1]MEA5543993.1 tetratricopeptide repeat protein [Limnoraphis robusta CCNP1324]
MSYLKHQSLLTASILLTLLFPLINIKSAYSFHNPTLFAQTQTDQQSKADELVLQGGQQVMAKKYQEAQESYQKALELYRQMGNRKSEAGTLVNLAFVYGHLNQHQKALELHHQALSIVQKMDDKNQEVEVQQAVIFMGIGDSYKALGQEQQAIEAYQQALPILSQIGDQFSQIGDLFSQIGYLNVKARILRNLGEIYVANNQPTEAIQYLEQSVQASETLRSGINGWKMTAESEQDYLQVVSKTYRTLAQLLKANGQNARAEEILKLLEIQHSSEE